MAYVEWLRVRNTLRILGIVLVALILLSGVVRLSVGHGIESGSWSISTSATSTHAAATSTQPRHASPTTSSTKLHTTGNDLLVPAGFASFIALILGMVFGKPLALENEHLEVVWTKPIRRSRLALQIFGVDVLGILATFAAGFIATMIVIAMWGPWTLFLQPGDWPKVIVMIAAPIAWYALLACATASMRGRGNYGLIVGAGWIVGFIVPGVVHMQFNGSVLLAGLVATMRVLAFFDPLSYFISVGSHVKASTFSFSDPIVVLVLVGLTVLYFAGALVQWRRVEA